MRGSMIPCLLLGLVVAARAQVSTQGNSPIVNGQRHTLIGVWVPVDPNSLPPLNPSINMTPPAKSCSFTVLLKPTGKRPVRYVQSSEVRERADGGCEMDFDVGDPTPDDNMTPLDDSGGGNGGKGGGGITVTYKDPPGLNVTQLWVGQSFSYDGRCVYNQNGWSGSSQLTASGWVLVGYYFDTGVDGLGGCPLRAHASATQGLFMNSVFCYAITGIPGTTYVTYNYVSDYGFVDGSTQWTWSAVPWGACSGLLHYNVTFT